MNQRIRYDKVSDSTLASRRVFTTAGGTQVRVELDATNKRFAIKDANNGTELLTGGETVNLAVLKIQAKDALKTLGVQFAAEDRAERSRQ